MSELKMEWREVIKTVLKAVVDYNITLVLLANEAEKYGDHKEVTRLFAMREGSTEVLHRIIRDLNEKEATCRTVSVTPVKNLPTG
jgi:hypothetical protein